MVICIGFFMHKLHGWYAEIVIELRQSLPYIKTMIKKQRKKLNLTQKALAEFLGTGERIIRYWEKGVVVPPDAVILLLAMMIDKGLTVDDVLKTRKELR